MGSPKKNQIWASELADYINGTLKGKDFLIENGLAQIRSTGEFGNVEKLGSPDSAWVLITDGYIPEAITPSAIIEVPMTPDQAFIELVKEYFTLGADPEIHPTALISPSAKIGKGVSIGAYSIIGDDVEIGQWSEIQHHVVVYGPTHIGSRVLIMDGAVIGNSSYQFIDNGEGRLLQPPQLGFVRIEDGVRIGSNTSIERSVAQTTSIGKETKIDDLVNIGGGSTISSRVLITAGCVLGREVAVGEGSHLGMKCSIRPNVVIGPNVIVGQGAVVVNDLLKNGTYVGVPAKILNK